MVGALSGSLGGALVSLQPLCGHIRKMEGELMASWRVSGGDVC